MTAEEDAALQEQSAIAAVVDRRAWYRHIADPAKKPTTAAELHHASGGQQNDRDLMTASELYWASLHFGPPGVIYSFTEAEKARNRARFERDTRRAYAWPRNECITYFPDNSVPLTTPTKSIMGVAIDRAAAQEIASMPAEAWEEFVLHYVDGAGEDVPILLGVEHLTPYDFLCIPHRSLYKRVGSYGNLVLNLLIWCLFYICIGAANQMETGSLWQGFWTRFRYYRREITKLSNCENNEHVLMAKKPNSISNLRVITSYPIGSISQLEMTVQESVTMASIA